MKTRRIHLQPGECVEIINPYGTSILKAVARFDRLEAGVVIYEQPNAFIAKVEDIKDAHLTESPIAIQVPITKQDSLV